MQSIFKNASGYFHPKILITFFLGFSSGLPFLLTLATLHAWLAESGINKTTIGIFVLVTIPYSLKFVWAPFIDHFKIPVLGSYFGKRRGWILTSQLLLMGSLVLLGSTQPQANIWLTAGAAFMVTLFSATQDIGIEAFRVESVKFNFMGLAATASSLGYRSGMWVSGAGALYLASSFDWFYVYCMMAVCVSIGIVTVLASSEPLKENPLLTSKIISQDLDTKPFWFKVNQQFVASFKTMLRRQDLKIILFFIFLYKVGDTILNTMTMPFLLETGFTKFEIANVAKSFGISAMVAGGLIGGLYVGRSSLVNALIVTSFLQIAASLMFWMQAAQGHNLSLLFATIGIENFASGMGNAAFIVYLSSRCRMPHTATHFALLTSFGSFCRVIFSSLAGWTADHLQWTEFYGLTALLCVPCLLLVMFRASLFSTALVPNPLSSTILPAPDTIKGNL